MLDGHVDLPWRLDESRDPNGDVSEDVSHRTAKGDFDWERAREGGLSAPFMSIYVPSKFEDAGAKKIADRLIDMVVGFAQKWPDKFATRPLTERSARQLRGRQGEPGHGNGERLAHRARSRQRALTSTSAASATSR